MAVKNKTDAYFGKVPFVFRGAVIYEIEKNKGSSFFCNPFLFGLSVPSRLVKALGKIASYIACL